MDYTPEIAKIFDKLRDANNFVIIEEATLHKHITEELEDFLDLMGEESRKARGLPSILTSSVKFTKNQAIYILTLDSKAIGFAKIQRSKKIFKTDEFGGIVEHKSTAVIDFHIHHKYQKQGYGKALLLHIVESEHLPKNQIGFYKINKGFNSFLNKVFKGK